MLQQRQSQCPKCQHAMEEGFTLDRSYGAILVGSWLEGAAEKGWTGSVKNEGQEKVRYHHLPLHVVWVLGVVCEPLANAHASLDPLNIILRFF
jgi:hypothetical protein